MTPDEMVADAIETAEEGMAAGELPIGAVVFMGDEVVGRAYTQERSAGRRLRHADMVAMDEADKILGWSERSRPLRLAISLEPCVMCLGAAMALGVAEIYYALESPGDGAHHIAREWRDHEDTPFFRAPRVTGGIQREAGQDLYRRYCEQAPDSTYRRWALTLASLSPPPA